MSASGQHSQHIVCFTRFSNRHVSTHAHTALSCIASREIKSLGKISTCMVYNTHTLTQTGHPRTLC